MRSYTLTTVLISSSLASAVLGSNIVIPRALQVRQGGDAFIPGTRHGTGTTCVDSFGPNSKLCADSGICYDSSIGDSCCSEGYPCGSGSFCLIKGYCCPNGDSPAKCALDNGVTLPANFGKTSAAAPKPTSSAAPVSSSKPAAVTTSSAAVVGPSSSAAPFPIPSKPITTPAASGTVSATSAHTGSSTLTPYTGAASPRTVVSGGALVAMLAGVMAVLL